MGRQCAGNSSARRTAVQFSSGADSGAAVVDGAADVGGGELGDLRVGAYLFGMDAGAEGSAGGTAAGICGAGLASLWPAILLHTVFDSDSGELGYGMMKNQRSVVSDQPLRR
jgi:hypothetical protein